MQRGNYSEKNNFLNWVTIYNYRRVYYLLQNLHLPDVDSRNNLFIMNQIGQATKSARGMPWRWEPKKDVAIYDKPRGAESRHRSVDFRMGKPGWRRASHCMVNS